MIDTSPDVVKRFVAAYAKGWLDAVKDPAAAIAALAKKDSLTDSKLKTEKLKWVIEHQILLPESRANGLGVIDLARLAKSIAIIKQACDLPVAPPAEQVFDANFLTPAVDRQLPA